MRSVRIEVLPSKVTSPITQVRDDTLTVRWRVSSSHHALLVAPFAVVPLGLAALLARGGGSVVVIAILLGLGLLAGYVALVLALNVKTLIATPERIEIREHPLPTGPRLAIPAADLAGFEVDRHDRGEDRRLHSVTARYAGGEDRTLLVTHADELAREIARALTDRYALQPRHG
jgi:hypothetical protein